MIQAGEDKLADMARQEQLLAQQFGSSGAKAEAELAQAREEVRQAKSRQAADVRLAELELQNAQYEEAQMRELLARQLIARDDYRKALVRVRETQERLDKARLPVDTGRVEVLHRALELVVKDYAVRREELQRNRRSSRRKSRPSELS